MPLIKQLVLQSKPATRPLVYTSLPLGVRYFSGAGYSSSWRTIDKKVGTTTPLLDPPDPLDYLQGFDAVKETKEYKQALLDACDLRPGDQVLDVGCGTATCVSHMAHQVGADGRVVGIDTSTEMIQNASSQHQKQQQDGGLKYTTNNVSFQVANTYDLPFPSHTFDCVKEDRVLEHLHRPLEALEEMRRVTKPGGIVVLGNPDFRSFQMDTFRQRWNDQRRPPRHIAMDLDKLTRRVLDGVIPTLASHSDMGLAQPRLLQAAGLKDIELKLCPIPLMGRKSLEAIIHITFMAQCFVENGAVTVDEMEQWLARLEWEGDDAMFGVLSMYVCRGVKPLHGETLSRGGVVPPLANRERPSLGTRFFPGWNPKPKHDVHVQFTSSDASTDLLQELTDLINEAYDVSDTGITLTSSRVKLHHVKEMVERGEILMALDEDDSNALVGCLQVQVKTKESANPNSKGLPVEEQVDRLGEFTCFAVRSTDHARLHECRRMQIAILCPADHEPAYKQWLQTYYLRLGYEHKMTQSLRFHRDDRGVVVQDELHEMYDPLHQLVACKAIVMDKIL